MAQHRKAKDRQRRRPPEFERGPRRPLVTAAPLAGRRLRVVLGLVLVVSACALYANTLTHDYALDDMSLMSKNTMVQGGLRSLPDIFRTHYRAGFHARGTSYRPLPKAMAAIEWQLAPGNPHLSHFINVALYALSGLLLFFVLLRILGERVPDPLIPFLAAWLFVAHPLHVEAVANIKGREEILGFLFLCLALLATHRHLVSRSLLALAGVSISILGALLSKESSVTYLLLVPFVAWFSWPVPWRRMAELVIAMSLAAGLFFLLRGSALALVGAAAPGALASGDSFIENPLFAAPDVLSRLASAVANLGRYLQLLVWPLTLSYDYSYAETQLVGVGDWRFLVSAGIYAGLVVYAALRCRSRDLLAFAIVFFLLSASVAANLVLLIGTAIGERLMFTPLLGFTLALAVALSRLSPPTAAAPPNARSGVRLSEFISRHRRPLAAASVLFVLYAARTVTRNRDWADNLTLLGRDAVTSARSAKAHLNLGGHLATGSVQRGLSSAQERRLTLDRAVAELEEALRIHPRYAAALQQLVGIHSGRGEHVKALALQQRQVEISPLNARQRSDYGQILFQLGRFGEAREAFSRAVELDPRLAMGHFNLGCVAVRQKQLPEAVTHFKRAIDLDPAYLLAYERLADLYEHIGNREAAVPLRQRLQDLRARGATSEEPR